MQSLKLFNIIGHKSLPTLPNILIKLMQTCRNGNNDLSELSSIIKKDPALSLKTMNLACAGRLRQHIHTISVEQAVHLIGMDAVHHIARWASAN
jgi:HD-like signal output (HDOD) protein